MVPSFNLCPVGCWRFPVHLATTKTCSPVLRHIRRFEMPRVSGNPSPIKAVVSGWMDGSLTLKNRSVRSMQMVQFENNP